MNEKTINVLEFKTIQERVAALALSEEAAQLILEDRPRLDKGEVQEIRKLVSAIQERIFLAGGEQRQALPAVGTILPKLSVEGAMLELEEAYALGVFIDRSGELLQWLQRPYRGHIPEEDHSSDAAALAARDLPDCKEEGAAIFKILDREGKLRDLKELREIRRRIQSLQKEIESLGFRYGRNEETRRMLQSELPSQRDGRMVLAVKANFRGRIRGIVHEVSSTGQTVFVEPEEAVEKNNELLIENRRLEAEIRRILRDLTAALALGRENLSLLHQGVLYLETMRARARYGHESRGIYAEDSQGRLILKQARHPLLGRQAVPLDLFMPPDIRTVIITGPNTGGKTVALKTLGLLAMMNQFGLAIPAEEETFLPHFDGIYADIGDEQSLSQSLSTFSGHMTNIAQILSQTSADSLVLLDELGSGTDPEEGSAIAMAILDHFIAQGTHLIVTTHHGILKNYGYTQEGVENASMEFDGRTLSPTFRIRMGIPGESRAVDIASRNGLPSALVDRARSYLREERSDVSALIRGLKEKHKELDEAAEAGKKETRKLREERREADLKELRLKQRELEIRKEGAGRLARLLGESRQTLENLVREVKEGELSREKTLKVKDFLSDLEEAVRTEEEDLEAEEKTLAEEKRKGREGESLPSGPPAPRTFEPGLEVLVGENRRPGRIIRLGKKGSDLNPPAWIVEVGALKMSISEAELQPRKENTQTQAKAAWTADLAPAAPAQLELKLLGLRLSEAQEALSRQIDGAIMAGLRSFAVVHGKGDGILSKGVQDFLRHDPRVESFAFSRPEQGGYGRTEVMLK
ncbi:MAG: endonuclease MutS2 [Treponema sp.]|nr:endonuclease MutS2 [Treponema sp.]